MELVSYRVKACLLHLLSFVDSHINLTIFDLLHCDLTLYLTTLQASPFLLFFPLCFTNTPSCLDLFLFHCVFCSPSHKSAFRAFCRRPLVIMSTLYPPYVLTFSSYFLHFISALLHGPPGLI